MTTPGNWAVIYIQIHLLYQKYYYIHIKDPSGACELYKLAAPLKPTQSKKQIRPVMTRMHSCYPKPPPESGKRTRPTNAK